MDRLYKSRFNEATNQWEVIEDPKHREQDDAILRRARIQNNVHPDYENGHPKSKEKTGK